MDRWVVYHVPSGKFYHPFKGLVALELAHQSTEPRDFEGSTEYVSMLYDNAQNNSGQQHFDAVTTEDFNKELKLVMNNNTGNKDTTQAPVSPDNEYRYIHYRAVRDALPQELAIKPGKELYIDSRGGATICFMPPSADSPIVYTIAYCSPKDNYCKETGRFKARHWFKANPANPNRRERGPQIAKGFDVKEFIRITDAEMEQWGYVRPMKKNRKPKGKKQAPLLLPSPETAVVEAEPKGLEPGTLDDFPNYGTG